MHEITEAYQGALYANKEGIEDVKPAYVGRVSNDAYNEASLRATRQVGQQYYVKSFRDKKGNIVTGVNEANFHENKRWRVIIFSLDIRERLKGKHEMFKITREEWEENIKK